MTTPTDPPPVEQQLAARIRSTIVAQLDVNGLAQRLATGCMTMLVPGQAELDKQRAHLAEVEKQQDERARDLGAAEDEIDGLIDLVRLTHDQKHTDGWAVCADPICREVVNRYG